MLLVFDCVSHLVADSLQAVHPFSVFANSEVDLAEIEAYGFDFDYTIAQYSSELHRAIYDMAKRHLVEAKLVRY